MRSPAIIIGALFASGCFADAMSIPGEGAVEDGSTGTPSEAEGTGSGGSDTQTTEPPTAPPPTTDGESTGEETSGDCEPGTIGCECDDGTCEGELLCFEGGCISADCGDGALDGLEDCDDGNDVTQDGCEANCTESVGIAKIANGTSHSCALFHDGRLRCWGWNGEGELGYGHTETIGDDEDPADAGDVPIGPVIDVSVGSRHTCAVLEGGDVKCWGDNEQYQLGVPQASPDLDYGSTPVTVPEALPITDIGGTAVAVTAGFWTTWVLLDDGTVRCFGRNWVYGSCGTGDGEMHIGDDDDPADYDPIPLLGTAVEVSGANSHACALLDDGTARCWGYNQAGALGTGDLESVGDDELPTAVAPIAFDEDIVQITTARLHTCARLESGEVRCWGLNDYGQLGLGNTDDQLDWSDAQPIALGGDAVHLASRGDHNCALLSTGDITCWGDQAFGRLGYTGNELVDIGDDEVPAAAGFVELPKDTTVHDISVGVYMSCIRMNEGEALCWGADTSGQIGQPDTAYVGGPHTPAILEGPIAI